MLPRGCFSPVGGPFLACSKPPSGLGSDMSSVLERPRLATRGEQEETDRRRAAEQALARVCAAAVPMFVGL